MNQELKFRHYLETKTKLGKGTCNTYISSLRTLNKHLTTNSSIKNIFKYKDFDTFYKVLSLIKTDPIFKQINHRDHQKHKKAIDYYLDFFKTDIQKYEENDEEYNKDVNDINISEKERLLLINNSQKPIKFSTSKIKKLIRDPRIGKLSLDQAKYKCELDSSHLTFISNTSGKQYMEAHHLIPCIYENCKKYDRHLDFIGNTISLCPNCHRAVHFGDKKTKNEILKKLFDTRKEQLNKNLQINLTFEELLSLY